MKCYSAPTVENQKSQGQTHVGKRRDPDKKSVQKEFKRFIKLYMSITGMLSYFPLYLSLLSSPYMGMHTIAGIKAQQIIKCLTIIYAKEKLKFPIVLLAAIKYQI